ncbi:hypothetical protein QBC37DRAFT_423209 [Rhypophila decipiens]|uniref:Uncharacterized protein n=1 Tax=Rhypophila decipiens TaxID=261697 RepID=A0AAN7B7W6_9PEZI|nr:hypothetical protein QBC37DRAFT_423209 [Rhypophila decipiens]
MAFISTSCLLLGFLCLAVSGALQPPRRVGMQAFRIMDTLWIHGGRFLHEDASVAWDMVPRLEAYNLTLDFSIPQGPVSGEGPTPASDDSPAVYHGFAFSNLIDRAWLFGGRPVDPNAKHGQENDVWRFELAAGDHAWTRLSLGSSSVNHSAFLHHRPYRGAGCNVPDLKRGYYLGGMTDDEGGFSHWLYEFDMERESMSSVQQVPMFVPVVNQSLVFLDTGSRQGALVALGGSVEKTKGSLLTPARLDSVFIYDIESRTWIEQAVSGLEGNAVQADGFPTEAPNGGIPRTRVSACAAVGSAQDKTSHNIFYLGGANETTSLSDIWVLSLPAAIWIKARLSDPYSSPKVENSCFLVNDRFIWMFGGCYFEGQNQSHCMGYSYNPLVYDMQLLHIDNYKSQPFGFFVHDNISAVVGGNLTGGAEQDVPMFTNFSDPLLRQLFSPPYSDRLRASEQYQYDPRAWNYLVAFLSVPFVTGSVFYMCTLARPTRKSKNWRPSVFSPAFLLVLNLVTVFLIALIAMLAYVGQLPDPDPGRWYGGLDADGIWTGDKYKSTFIRSPTLSRPPQGLISFYQDEELQGIWSQRNSTQRIPPGIYWAFTYLPTLVAVLYGRLWKVLDDEVKRIDMYVRLQRHHGGERAKDSLFLQYHSFWLPLSIYQGLKHGHWRVAISSLGVTLGSIIAPIIQNYVFAWTLYSGGHLPWPDTYSWLIASVDEWWSKVLMGVLGSALLCSLALLVLLPSLDTGLQEDPRGIASIVYLIPGGFPPLFQKTSNKQTLTELLQDIGDLHFQLVVHPNRPMPILEPVTTNSPPTTTKTTSRPRPSWMAPLIPSKPTIAKFNNHLLIRTTKKHASTIQAQLKNYLLNHPLSLPLRPEIYTLWLLLLLTLLILTSTIASAIDQNARDKLYNYTIPLSPNIYLILSILTQSIADVLDFSIRSLHPFYELRKHGGAKTADILFDDYAASLSSRGVFSLLPVVDVIRAWRKGHHLVCMSVLASMGLTVVSVFLGSLQLSSSQYGSTTFLGDQTAATGAAWILGLGAVVYLAARWRIGRVLLLPRNNKKTTMMMMKRPVETVMGIAPYVIFSEKLRADLEHVACLDAGERARELVKRGNRYAMGVWSHGPEELCGVERQFDGPGRVDADWVL